MTTKTMENNIIGIIANELVNRKNNSNFTTQRINESITQINLKKENKIKTCCINIKKFSLYIYSIYRPIINYIDKYFSLYLLKSLESITTIIVYLRGLIEKYIKRKKYSDLGQFNQTLKDIDIAYISLAVGYYQKITIYEIIETFNISYHNAIRVNKMRKDKLKALGLINEEQKRLKELNLINEAIELQKENELIANTI